MISTTTGTVSLGLGVVGAATAPEGIGFPVEGVAAVFGSVSLSTGLVATAGDCSASVDAQCELDALGSVTGLGAPAALGLHAVGTLGDDAAKALDLTSQFVGQAFAWAGTIIGVSGR